jgi:hypothetical protein
VELATEERLLHELPAHLSRGDNAVERCVEIVLRLKIIVSTGVEDEKVVPVGVHYADTLRKRGVYVATVAVVK